VRNSIIYKNNISKKYINQSSLRKNKKKTSLLLKSILESINIKKDVFYLLSKKYKLDFDNDYLKKSIKYKKIIIIGMGGSILGSEAIYSFLKHKIKKKFIFVNNLDEQKILDLYNKKNKRDYFFIIISKSGNTIETLTNINLLKSLNINSKNSLIITENKKNALFEFSKKMKIKIIKHKTYVGGRYSVLSEVGMVPAYLMGLNIKNFRKNLQDYFYNKKNILIDNASKLFQVNNSKKIDTIVFLNYNSQLNNFILWCQQLIAESLGKNGKGLFPVLSEAPKDHHSLLQLYLDGPRNKFFYIFSAKSTRNLKMKKNYFESNFSYLKNKSINKIVNSQKKALIKVLKNKKIPFREIHINSFSEETLGELFAYFMTETVAIAKLMNINPFDQPAVEEVKMLTKKYLT
tara:strand:- start:5 stop:1216 length:1212 start_codon:yes stop_codon:yes gene_type:complete